MAVNSLAVLAAAQARAAPTSAAAALALANAAPAKGRGVQREACHPARRWNQGHQKTVTYCSPKPQNPIFIKLNFLIKKKFNN